ncbi:MAG TPA: dihydroxyacetone kinase phosphoryl donor subunit DhaM [Pseudonocardiaceae bacterium]
MTVGLVIVSHSARLAEGVLELVAQMAPDVPMAAAGGAADGGLGTDYDAVSAALRQADRGSGVVVLYDLGSAEMTAELAVESMARPDTASVVDAPLVEGAVAAGVAAQGGADREAVRAAAMAAGRPEASAQTTPVVGEERETEIVLTNEIGLHARPAALLARSVAGLDADVTVTFGDQSVASDSVLGLMALGARAGDRIRVSARGAQAAEALRRIEDLAQRGFE